MMRRKCFLIILTTITLIYSLTTFADSDFSERYQQAIQSAKQLRGSVKSNMNGKGPSYIPGFKTENPAETNYETQDLQGLAATHQDPSGADDAVRQSFNQRPFYTVSQNDPALKRAQRIESSQTAIVGGQGDSVASCRVVNQCKPSYEVKPCMQAHQLQNPSCTERLIVNVEESDFSEKEINVYLGVYSGRDATVTVDLKAGRIVSSSGTTQAHVHIEPELLEDAFCPNLQLTYKRQAFYNDPAVLGVYNSRRVTLDITQQPSCANGLKATFTIHQGHHKNYGWKKRGGVFTYSLRYKPKPHVTNEYWSEGCATLKQFQAQRICRQTQEAVCVDGPATKDINGLLVTRSCWKKETKYQCQNQEPEPSCAPLQTQGCEQTASTCKTSINGICLQYEQTYRCIKNACENTQEQIVCGKPVSCTDGNCGTEQSATAPDEDFNQAMAELSALANASSDFNANQIFKGKVSSCRKDGFGFSNCCNDDGWGQGIGLAQCNDEEKQLGEDKQNGLCVEVGTKCVAKAPITGSCIKKKKVYCCYNSKLGRIVQQQGRPQIGLNFGSGKNPSCSGLSAEQLQQLNFGEMDFSEAYADIRAKMRSPAAANTQTRIQQRVQGFYEQYEN